MIVEIISVGTELLLGNIVNTNANYLAKECAGLGLSLYHQSVVGDNMERAIEVIKTAWERSDIVILTGGLGPTEDDMTKEACAKVLGRDLIEDEHSKKRIIELFNRLGRTEITENNWKQAVVIKNSIVLDNPNGIAPGIIAEDDKKAMILLPGPPNELYPLFNEAVKPYLKRKTDKVIVSTMVKICGMGESKAETVIHDMIEAQTNPTVAPYAKTGEVHFRITAMADTEAEAEELIKPAVNELECRFGEMIFSTDEDESLADVVIRKLKLANKTLALAESCTGGLLASAIVDIAGASEVFKEGYITYSNNAKISTLGVDEQKLQKFGAVSEEIAFDMAVLSAKLAKTECSLSITGIAGPNGDTEEKPVGLVYIGCVCGKSITVEKHNLSGNRQKIREQAVIKALDLLRRELSK
jgi:competence/damage-inducible protein CinA C-terminal domain